MALRGVFVTHLSSGKRVKACESIAEPSYVCLRSARLLGWPGKTREKAVQLFTPAVERVNPVVAPKLLDAPLQFRYGVKESSFRCASRSAGHFQHIG